jgi:hypothetical protein
VGSYKEIRKIIRGRLSCICWKGMTLWW